MSILKVTTIQNGAGTEVYTAKTRVNFNGTGTVAIRGSGNVSSISDFGTGDFAVVFSTTPVDANYSAVANYSTTNTLTGAANDGQAICWLHSTISCHVLVVDGAGGVRDPIYCSFVNFR